MEFSNEVKANIEVEAVIIRADGTRIPLGVIDAKYELSPDKQLNWDLFGKAAADRRIELVNAVLRSES